MKGGDHVARIYRGIGELPILHVVGLSDELFLAICDVLEEKLGGKKVLNKINKEKIFSAIELYKELDKKERSENNNGDKFYVECRAKRTVFLTFNTYFVDVETGEVQLSLNFPLWGTARHKDKVVKKVIEEAGMTGYEWDDLLGMKLLTVSLQDENMPVLARKESFPFESCPSGCHYVTRREFEKANAPVC